MRRTHLDAVDCEVEQLVLQAAHDDEAQAQQGHLCIHVLAAHHLPHPLQPQVHLRDQQGSPPTWHIAARRVPS